MSSAQYDGYGGDDDEYENDEEDEGTDDQYEDEDDEDDDDDDDDDEDEDDDDDDDEDDDEPERLSAYRTYGYNPGAERRAERQARMEAFNSALPPIDEDDLYPSIEEQIGSLDLDEETYLDLSEPSPTMARLFDPETNPSPRSLAKAANYPPMYEDHRDELRAWLRHAGRQDERLTWVRAQWRSSRDLVQDKLIALVDVWRRLMLNRETPKLKDLSEAQVRLIVANKAEAQQVIVTYRDWTRGVINCCEALGKRSPGTLQELLHHVSDQSREPHYLRFRAIAKTLNNFGRTKTPEQKAANAKYMKETRAKSTPEQREKECLRKQKSRANAKQTKEVLQQLEPETTTSEVAAKKK